MPVTPCRACEFMCRTCEFICVCPELTDSLVFRDGTPNATPKSHREAITKKEVICDDGHPRRYLRGILQREPPQNVQNC